MYLDTETTSVWHEGEIIQMAGCIEYEPDKFDYWFQFKIKPYDFSVIKDEALKVNGCTLEEISTYDDGEKVMKEFLQIISPFSNNGYFNRLCVAGYNVNFDVHKLLNFFARVYNPDHSLTGDYTVYYKEYYKHFQNRNIDVMQLVPLIERKIKNVYKSHKLEDMYKCFFPDDNSLQAHNALCDVQMTIKLHKVMLKMLNLN